MLILPLSHNSGMKLTPLRFVCSPNEAKRAELKPETETKQCNKIMFGAIGIWGQ